MVSALVLHTLFTYFLEVLSSDLMKRKMRSVYRFCLMSSGFLMEKPCERKKPGWGRSRNNFGTPPGAGVLHAWA